MSEVGCRCPGRCRLGCRSGRVASRQVVTFEHSALLRPRAEAWFSNFHLLCSFSCISLFRPLLRTRHVTSMLRSTAVSEEKSARKAEAIFIFSAVAADVATARARR